MRVFSATLATETNTFSPIPTGLASYAASGIFRAGQHPDRPTMFTAPLWAARVRGRERGWTLFEGLCAFAQPAGLTVRAAYESLRDELLADLKKALPVDAVLLGLHGAMVAEGYEDCEGDLLERVRALAGKGAVVGATLDPHCHLTERMLRHADLLICFKEYPHTDFMERAYELADLAAAVAAKKVRPVKSTFDCRMISAYHTTREPMKSFVAKIRALEGKDGVLSISVAQGFPWGDVADLGTRMLVITDNRPDHGAALAERLGRELYELRGQTYSPHLALGEAVGKALEVNGWPVVLADTADNPGGGAPGDSTFVLEELLAKKPGPVAFGPLYDPMAVAFCFEAGLGARLPLRIGGKTGPASGRALDLDCEVRHLARASSQSFGQARAPTGDVATVRAGEIDIVLTTVRGQAMGTDLFTAHGVDLGAKRLIVVKSSQHFHAAFAPIAKAVFYIAGPGAIVFDVPALPYTKVRRPKWPLDADTRRAA
jgi:microcystin degradation protein MlrC